MSRHGTDCRFTLAALAAAALLGGCAGASTDPHTGGLAGGITGLATGAYEQRIAAKEADLGSLNAAEAALARRVGSAEDRLRDIGRQIDARKTGLQKLRAELGDLDRRIAVIKQTIAVERGMEASVIEANRRRKEALKPLEEQRDRVHAMTSALEKREREDAAYFDQLKIRAPNAPAPQAPAGSDKDRMIADLADRVRSSDQKRAEAEDLIKKLRVQVAQLGG